MTGSVISRTFCVMLLVFALAQISIAQTLEFTYQGNLQTDGNPANGNYYFEFALYDAPTGGTQLGNTQVRNNIPVVNGLFSVVLNVGFQFSGADRWLEIRVSGPVSPMVKEQSLGNITTLSPRQKLTSSPYSIRSASAANATTANNAAQLGGIFADQYVLTGDTRLSDARNPLPNSSDYIQNTASQQASSEFNISGTGKANIFDAETGFSIATNPVLKVSGEMNFPTSNTFVGVNAGLANPSGTSNSFFGSSAGKSNTTGNMNSFLGISAGISTISGSRNTFVGAQAGILNVSGNGNTLIGQNSRVESAGLSNATAIGGFASVATSNSLVLGSINGINGATEDTNVGIGTLSPGVRLHVVGNGLFTGNLTVNGSLNATLPPGSASYIQNSTNIQSLSNFYISGTGIANVLVASRFELSSGTVLNAHRELFNTSLGLDAGPVNTGSSNSFFGRFAGFTNGSGLANAFFGAGSGFQNTSGSNNSFFGSNSGESNTTGTSNAFFGYRAGTANTTGVDNSFFGRGAGENNKTIGADIGDNNTFIGRNSGNLNTTGLRNTAVGAFAFAANQTGSNNTVVGRAAGNKTTSGDNSFFGNFAGRENTIGTFNTFVGRNAGLANITGTNNTTLGANSDVEAGGLSYATAIGADAVVATSNTIQLGRTNGSDTVNVGGKLKVTTLGATGATPLCYNASKEIATCSSSIRYKSNIVDFRLGIDLIKRLRPVSFKWKGDGMADMGLVAEGVAEVEPLLVTSNEKGEIEGVKYDRVSVLLINAVKEQQEDIDKLRAQNLELERQLERLQEKIQALTLLVCASNEIAEICKEE